MPGPQGCVGGCLRVVTRGMAVGGRFRGASGTPAPTGCPGKGGSGRLPLIRPCGATFPRGGRQGLLLAAAQASAGRRGRRPLRVARERAVAEGRGGVRAPRPTDGDMETLRGLRRHPFPGRRTVGAGHARPGGWREHPSMVRSVGRGLDPSAGDCPGDGRWREVSGASGTPPPTACPGMGGSGSLPLIRPCGATFPQGGRQGLYGGSGRLSLPRQLVLGAELEGQAVVPAV